MPGIKSITQVKKDFNKLVDFAKISLDPSMNTAYMFVEDFHGKLELVPIGGLEFNVLVSYLLDDDVVLVKVTF